MEERTESLDPALVAPLLRTRPGYWVLVGILSAIVAWGLYAYIRQLGEGLGVTGMNRPVYWGLYITSFVFFIGISHAGTLISAILRVVGAEWRRPITRAAETITVIALILAGLMIMVDMGQPGRLANLLLKGRFESPLLWDVMSVGLYLLGSIFYLYLPLIPDMAILRDRLPATLPGWRRGLYRLLALGWHGGSEQRRRLEKAIGIMAILIIPLAISVHTIVSWIFAMTLQPMWRSTIFGPYFVVGAIYSGIAALLIAMALIRRVLHLEDYLKQVHFRYLGLLLIVMNAAWFYFTFAEYLTTGYGAVPHEMNVFYAKLFGEFSLAFWGMVVMMAIALVLLLLPYLPAPKRLRLPAFRPRFALAPGGVALSVVVMGILLRVSPTATQAGLAAAPAISRWLPWLLGISLALLAVALLPLFRRNFVAGTTVASLLVILGMWLERLTIVVPTLTRPILLFSTGVYKPTWIEWSILAGAFAGFVLLYVVFIKLFPIISIWEVQEASEAVPESESSSRIQRSRVIKPAEAGAGGE